MGGQVPKLFSIMYLGRFVHAARSFRVQTHGKRS
jgi:hypothetical protein